MSFRLVVKIGDRALRFPLTRLVQLLGSGTDADLRVGHPAVSRRHASMTMNADGVTITDLESSNGTRVGGNRLDGPTLVTAGTPV